MNDTQKGLSKLREPFDPKLISKLPKGTKAQNECPPAEKKNCAVCGGWHHPRIVHLDYVGHAAITDRLLDADPMWNWEPVRKDEHGAPILDGNNGGWIKLTVCGVTRMGYGDATGKVGAAAVKEFIGDAIRNAAMRFGAALDLWSKVDIHFDEHDSPTTNETIDNATGEITKPEPKAPGVWPQDKFDATLAKHRPTIMSGTKTTQDLLTWMATKAPLTDAQKAAVLAINPDAEPTAEEIAAIHQREMEEAA